MRRPLVGVVLALTLVVGAIFMQAAAPAGAATPNAGAWVIAPQWWGWCPGGSVNRPVQVNVINYTAAGCPPILSYYSFARPNCQEFNRNALDIIKRYGVKTVILSARWTSLRLRGVDEIRSTLDELRTMGVHTYLIGQSTEFGASMDVLDYRTGNVATAAPRLRRV